MRVVRPRFSFLSWLLAGALLLSVGLNVYCLVPHQPLRAAARWAVDDDDWAEDEDDEDEQPLAPSRAVLADELRRARLQLDHCREKHASAPTHKSAKHRSPHPHG